MEVRLIKIILHQTDLRKCALVAAKMVMNSFNISVLGKVLRYRE